MSFNNMSNVTSPKKNLRRTNRLQNNGNFTPFDNAGFEDDKDNASAARRDDSTPNSIAKDEKRKKYGENATKSYRRLPNDGKSPANTKTPATPQTQVNFKAQSNTKMSDTKKSANSKSKGSTPFTSPNQNVFEPESIELKLKDGNLKQNQGDRKILEPIDLMSKNKQETESKTDEFSEERDQVSPLAKKPSFLMNLKRFEATLKGGNNNLKQLLRPALTLDIPNDDVDASPFTRTQSLREGKGKLKQRRLLRDISFSDVDDSLTKDYGALKNINLPRRHEKGPVDPSIESILESLMHELIKRGKVHHIAVLDQEESTVLASVPTGLLTKGDAVGMTRSIICPTSLFKLRIGGEDYSCFKHRQDAVQGRAPDLVMVMQMTKTCVVVGFSRDDAPGSCNSEVHEFTKVLEEVGW